MHLRIRRGSAILASAVWLIGCASDPAATTETAAQTSTTQAAVPSTTQIVATSTTQTGPDVCAATPPLGLTTSAVQADGRVYPTEIYQPRGRDAVRIAAVIDLHGLDSNGPTQAALTGFHDLAEREGFVVAEPSGPVVPLGVTGWEIAALDEPDRDDLGAMNQLIDILVRDYCVDPDRIFAAGYSNGGLFAAELACQRGSRIAAIVVVAGFHTPEPCERHVPTVVMHGTADPIVPLGPNGASIIIDDTTPQAVRELLSSSIEQEVDTSAIAAGCNDTPLSTRLADDVTELSYEGCAGGADHHLILVDGGGHTWPGAAPMSDAEFLGPTTTNISATEMAWAFFASHSKHP